MERKVTEREVETRSRIRLSDGERSALGKLLRRILEGPVRGSVRIDLGDGGGVCDATLIEVRKQDN